MRHPPRFAWRVIVLVFAIGSWFAAPEDGDRWYLDHWLDERIAEGRRLRSEGDVVLIVSNSLLLQLLVPTPEWGRPAGLWPMAFPLLRLRDLEPVLASIYEIDPILIVLVDEVVMPPIGETEQSAEGLEHRGRIGLGAPRTGPAAFLVAARLPETEGPDRNVALALVRRFGDRVHVVAMPMAESIAAQAPDTLRLRREALAKLGLDVDSPAETWPDEDFIDLRHPDDRAGKAYTAWLRDRLRAWGATVGGP